MAYDKHSLLELFVNFLVMYVKYVEIGTCT